METQTPGGHRHAEINRPLAERIRPRNIDEIIGQQALVGVNGVLRKMVQLASPIPSMIFWGPPGVGKTTLAFALAQSIQTPFFSLSAIQAGVKEMREVFAKATEIREKGPRPILFIDEIHRFSKSQQDALLAAVEKGIITLIGATTENPSFEIIAALLSRMQVFTLKALDENELDTLISKALKEDILLRNKHIEVQEKEVLYALSAGDGRKLLNLLELTVQQQLDCDKIIITNALVNETLQQHITKYDKQGEQHYNIISAFIKSMRGSDPNGALYWLARMTEAGEDPKFIARRMLILASEDIGNANPNALLMATNCFQAVSMIGYPECDLILSQTAIYLATSPKSNSSYNAIRAAQQWVRKTGDLPVPLHLRNASTELMKELNFGKDYIYTHNYENNFAHQEYLPEAISGKCFFEPGNNKREQEIQQFLNLRWKGKYGKY